MVFAWVLKSAICMGIWGGPLACVDHALVDYVMRYVFEPHTALDCLEILLCCTIYGIALYLSSIVL